MTHDLDAPPTDLREYSIRTKTWMTDDGRWLISEEITADHLHNIRRMLVDDLPRGYDLAEGRRIAETWLRRTEKLPDDPELDRDAYAATWIQIIDDELLRRNSPWTT